MSENNYAQISDESAQTSLSYAQTTPPPLSPDEFALAVGSTRQTVSYHLRQGLLKRHVDSGKITTDPYQIPDDLVDWFLEHNGRKVGASVPKVSRSAKRFAQSAQIFEHELGANVSANESQFVARLFAKYEEDLRKAAQELADIKHLQSAKEAQIEYLRTELEKSRIEHSALQGKMETINSLLDEKDKTIAAKDQAINAANAVVMLMESKNQTLTSAESKQIQGAQAEEENKKGWFDKILGR